MDGILYGIQETFSKGQCNFFLVKKTNLVKALSDKVKYGIIRKFL